MMNCEEAKSLLTKYLLEDLDEAQASAVRAHIEKCDSCRAEADEIQPTLDLLRDALSETAPAPARLEVDKHAAIYAEPPSKMGRVITFVTSDYPVVRRLASVLVICFIFAFLAAISLPSFVKSRESARSAASVNNLRQVSAAVEMYKLDNNGKTPGSVKDISDYINGEKVVGVLSGEEMAYNFYAEDDGVLAVDQGEDGTAVLYGDGRIQYEKKEKPKSNLFGWFKMGEVVSESAAPEIKLDSAPDGPAPVEGYAVPRGGGDEPVKVMPRVKKKGKKLALREEPAVIFSVPDLDGAEVDEIIDEEVMETYTAVRSGSASAKAGKGGAGAPGWPQGIASPEPPATPMEPDSGVTPQTLDEIAPLTGASTALPRYKAVTSAGGGVPAPAKPAASPPKSEALYRNLPDFQVDDPFAAPLDSTVTYEAGQGGPAVVNGAAVSDAFGDMGGDDSSVAATGLGPEPKPVDSQPRKSFMEKIPVIGGLFGGSFKSETGSMRDIRADSPAEQIVVDDAGFGMDDSDASYDYDAFELAGKDSGGSVAEKSRRSAHKEQNKNGRASREIRAEAESLEWAVKGFSGGEKTKKREEAKTITPKQSVVPADFKKSDGQQKELVAKEAERALERENKANIQLSYAEAALERGQITAAAEHYSRAAEGIEDKKSEAYLDAGLGVVETSRVSKDYDRALKDLDKLEKVVDEKGRDKVLAAKAQVLMETEDFAAANEEIEEVLKSDPGNKDALVLRGKIQTKMRELEEAAEIELGKAEEEETTGTRFIAYGVNPVINVSQNAFSTFSIDVDTASYTLTRNYIVGGQLPPAESVRTEEIVNFFDYDYKAPVGRTFAVYAEAAPSKFGRGLHMLKIGVKGKRIGREEQRRAALTFLIDTSGSMEKPDRIELVKKSLKMLVERLNDDDTVSIVQYDSRARLVISHTAAKNRQTILKAIDSLQCSGSTNLEQGLHKAYAAAASGFVSKGENRVLIMSDGVANLGNLDAEGLLAKVAKYRDQGIYCSVFGVGMGTYDDVMLETLANKGDGTYAYLDSEAEARRLFVDDLSATLNTIAKDVKIQVEFNERMVKTYRQLGYENRQLTKEQFRDDTVDAGEVGSGQSVTALYELDMKKAISKRLGADPIATVRVRYRRTDNDAVEEIEIPVTFRDFANDFNKADVRFRLAACAAEFAEILRGSPYAKGSDYRQVSGALRPVALELSLDQRVQEFLRLTTSAPGMARGK